MLYLVKLLDGKPVCCGGITFPDDVSRASAESAGYVSTTGANIRIIRLYGSDDSNTEVSRISILAFGTY